MSADLDDELDRLIRSRGGVLCRRDHPAYAYRLHRLVRSGRIWSPLPGVFALDELRDVPEALIAAGMLWVGPDAVVCGWAAARIGFWPGCRVPQIELATRHAARRARPGWSVVRRRIPPELVHERGSVRYTSPALTAVDLASGPRGGEVIDQALRTGAATLEQLWHAFALTPARTGNPLRSLLLVDSRDRPWSEAERLLHRLLRQAGLTGWSTNVPIAGTRFCADVCFARHRLVVEVDGWETHGTRAAFESDRRRRNELVLAGYRVLNVTWRQLVDDPAWVVDCVRRALAG